MRFIVYVVCIFVVLKSMQGLGVTSIHLYYLAGLALGGILVAIGISEEIER